jgi:ketosteroid isomerase-like protein
MRQILAAVAALLLLTPLALAQSPEDHALDGAYIRQAESAWAEAVATNDVNVLERILADDFVGVDIDGSHYSKADAIKDFRDHFSEFEFNHLNEVEIHFYGEAAVAQGNEGWKKKNGSVGKFVWTDTWIKRGGKWQIVAAEDLVPLATPSSATSAGSQAREADSAGIEVLHKADVDATLTQDPGALNSLWSKDGVNLQTPGAPVAGIKALKEFYDKFRVEHPEFKVLKYSPDFKDLQIVDGWAIEVVDANATFKMSANEDAVTVQQRLVRVLKRQSDGSWKFALVARVQE